MFTISVETSFYCSHQLTLPDGSKEAVHNHNWIVTADVSSQKLNNMGLVMDFVQLKKMLEKIVSEFEGGKLEENAFFKVNNPSAEAVAEYIYQKLEVELTEEVMLESISVVEKPGCCAKFSK